MECKNDYDTSNYQLVSFWLQYWTAIYIHVYLPKKVKEIVFEGLWQKNKKCLKTFELHNSLMWPFFFTMTLYLGL